MRERITLVTSVLVLVFSAAVVGEPNDVQWNADCPPPFGVMAAEGKALQKEIPDFQKDMRLQLEWSEGRPCKDANSTLKAEVAMTDRVIRDILKPEVCPVGLPAEKHIYLKDVALCNRTADAIVIQWKKGQYIVKVMKTVGVHAAVYITVRKVGSQVADVPQFVADVFADRILPARWEYPFYLAQLKRESKIMKGGAWEARDTIAIDASGHRVELDADSPQEWGPIGEGRYKQVDFCTNGDFICLKILGGPKTSLTREVPAINNAAVQ